MKKLEKKYLMSIAKIELIYNKLMKNKYFY